MNSSLQNHGQVQSLFARAVGRIGFTTTPGFHMIGDCRGLWVVFKHLFWGTQLISGLSFAIFEGRAIPCYHTTWGLCPGSSPSEWLREDEHWDFDHNFVWIQWTSGTFWMICWDVIQQQVGTDSKHVVLKPWRVNHGAHDHGMRIPEIQVLRQFWRPPCDRGGWQLDFGDVGFSYVGTIFWNQQRRRNKNNDVKVYKGPKVQNIIWSKSLSLVPWPSLQCHQRVTVSISRWS